MEDFEVISKVFENFKPNIYFSWKEVLKLYKKNQNYLLQIQK